MFKTKLPVIVLRNMILLPHGELKLEVSNESDKNIIYKSRDNHENYVLLISPECITEETLKVEDLPLIGTIGKITSNFELPNDNMRLSIIGVNRAKIYEYLEEETGLDAIIGPVMLNDSDKLEEEALLRMLKKETSSYITSSTNISNGLISKIIEEPSLDKLTDMIVNMLPLKFDLKVKYVYETDALKRAELLIKNIIDEKKIGIIDKSIDAKLKRDLDKANREYILKEKIKVIKEELGEDIGNDIEIEELKEKVSKLNANDQIKTKLYKEIKRYETMPSTSPEVSIVRNYIDTMINLPWGIYTEDNKNIGKIEKLLNKTHFGLRDVKERILEYISVKQLTSTNKSPIICLVGPPGVGKTSLAYSIAEALNRKFVKISVGGVSDEAEIIGHRRTYMGAQTGRIIAGIKKAKTSNPVFLIDEIDKMTKDIKGDPASSLLEVLDPEQNTTFYDNYIEEAYDLSKVMFILTANNLNDIPYALRDRLEIINLPSYTMFEKVDIVKTHMYDKLLKEHGLNKSMMSISDEIIKYIISYYTKEAGVRDLERVLSKIMRIVAKNIVKTNKKSRHVINMDTIYDYLGKEKYHHIENDRHEESGIVNGLAYTSFGGEILPIEASYYSGKGSVIMTGQLGKVMKESAEIALGYVKSHAEEFDIDLKKLKNSDVHINAINGAIPKNGPSAGIALTTVIISMLKDKKIPNDIAMTGEVTLRGNILGVGGLREKSTAAYNSGIKTIYIPKDNEADLDEIPDEVKENLNIVFISNYKELYDILFK